MNAHTDPNVLYKIYFNRWNAKQGIAFIMPIQNRFIKALEARYKALHPRARKIDITKLPVDERVTIINQYKAIVKRRSARGDNVKRAYETWMNNNAPGIYIEKTAEPYQIDSVYSGSYSSQTQAEKYAQNSMLFSELKLQQRKIDYQIAEKDANYILIANIEPWTFDAIKRSTFVSLMEWAIGCWMRGVNPKVYDPYLPDNVFEQSCKIAMKG